VSVGCNWLLWAWLVLYGVRELLAWALLGCWSGLCGVWWVVIGGIGGVCIDVVGGGCWCLVVGVLVGMW